MNAPLTVPDPRTGRWIRRKGRLTPAAWTVALGLGALVIAIVALKLAGSSWLVESLSLAHLPPSIQGRLGHLVVVPIGAIVVALVRLTLNLRTLGPFRPILLAMAFESVGYGLGLAFFAIVTSLVMALRPLTKRLGLPYYARVLTIVSGAAFMVVVALLVASASGVADLGRVAAFPIVVLALTGDTSSRILARDGWRTLLSRHAVTIGTAAVIALLAGSTITHDALVRFPELLLLQLLALVVVSELFDIRLVPGGEDAKTRAKRERRARRMQPLAVRERSADELATMPLRIAVVRNRSRRGVIGRSGRRAKVTHSRKAIQRVLEALRSLGFEAKAFEGDASLLASLATYLPVDATSRRVHGLVFNLADGVQGECPSAQVPAMLELGGIPSTGATQRGHIVCGDVAAMREALRAAGLPTPSCSIIDQRAPVPESLGLELPLVVRPRNAHAERQPRVVTQRAELESAVAAVHTKSRCDAVIESHVEGRSFSIVTLGHGAMRTLPVTELVPTTRPAADGPPKASVRRVCPAKLEPDIERRLRTLATEASKVCGVRDLARVDLRLDALGELQVMAVHAAPSLGWAGIAVKSARRAGYSFAELLGEMVGSACERHGIDHRRVPRSGAAMERRSV